MRYVVGMDEGTTGCKVAVYNEKGEMVSIAADEYPCYYPQPGWVEQDILEIRKKVFGCCKKAIEKSGIDPSLIVGVSYSNQGITLVPVDEFGKPVFDHTIGWQDVRHIDILEDLKNKIDLDKFYQKAGVPFGAFNTSSLIWLQRNYPDKWKKVKRICCHQDFFMHELGGEYVVDSGNAAFLCFMDVENNKWDEETLKLHGLSLDMMPRITFNPGEVVGKINSKVSQETGLPIGCLICSGGLDANCCCLGAGAIEPGTAALIVGTAGVVTVISKDRLIDKNKILTARRNPGTDYWQIFSMTNTAASSFRWFRDSLCSLEVAASKLLGSDPYDLMTEIASTSNPGSNGVTALTCLQGAHVHHLNEKMRGTFFGIGLNTTKGDIAHSILEGICYEMKAILDMTQTNASKITEVRLCGGVTKSKMWCQMFADILNIKICLTKDSELGCRGASIYAMIGSKIYDDVLKATEDLSSIEHIFEPIEENVSIYKKSFNTWKKGYDSVIKSFYQ